MKETKVWLMFAKAGNYLSKEVYDTMFALSDTLGATLYKLYENWKSS
ncbi:MAG TPA: hypothetical protein VEY10_06935 [Flavisolibacter sp.]|jgi:hypothetical protein|nr:hypothetical protein [Flavisolibacter sp.]